MVAAYLLSPMTVWFAIGIVPLVLFGTRGLDSGERRWVTRIVVVAIALRVLVVAGLFLMTDHAQVPFGTFFGDEEYFLKRSLWLRNMALGIPLHALDLEYAFEPQGGSGYLSSRLDPGAGRRSPRSATTPARASAPAERPRSRAATGRAGCASTG